MAADREFYRWLSGVRRCTISPDHVNPRNQELLDGGLYHDISIQCGDKHIQCHRSVLATSPVLHRQFQSSFKDGKDAEVVKVDGVKSDTFYKVLRYIYSFSIDTSGDDVMDILQLADMYELSELSNKCVDALFEQKTDSVSLMLWRFARRYNVVAAARKCKRYCVKHFRTCSNGFLECDPDAVRELLQDPELRVSSESEVFTLLVDWAAHQADRARWQHFKQLYDACIRTEFLDCDAVLATIERFNRSDADRAFFYNFIYNIKHLRYHANVNLSPRVATDVIENLTLCLSSGHDVALVRYACVVDEGVDYVAHVLPPALPEAQDEVVLVSGEHIVVCCGSDTDDEDCDDYVFDIEANSPWKASGKKHLLCAPNMLTLPDKRMLTVHSDTDQAESTVHFKSFPNEKAWIENEYSRSTSAGDVTLLRHRHATYYAGHVFVFITKRNLIDVFNAETAEHEKTVSAQIASLEPVCFAAKHNIQLIVSRSGIKVLDLDTLLQTRADAVDSSDVKPLDAKKSKPDRRRRRRRRDSSGNKTVADVWRLHAPVLQEVRIADAEIYANRLYVAIDQPLTSDVILYVGDLKLMFCLPGDKRHVPLMPLCKVMVNIGIDVVTHICRLQSSAKRDDVTFALVTSRMKNPFL